MKIVRANDLLVSLAVAILCCGCSTKPLVLPATSPERRAHIRGMSSFSLTEGAVMETIDGQTLIFANSADVSPGPHVARVCFTGVFFQLNQKCEDLRFVAEGGHSYVVCGTSVGFLKTRIYLWIEDERTGRTVAGAKP